MQYISVEVASQKSFDFAMQAYTNFINNVPMSLKSRRNGVPAFPKIIWKKKGYRLAGTAKAWCNQIEMNINFLCSPSYEEFIKRTVIHELAHIINRYYYGYNHDNQWKMIDRLLGNSGDRCHNYITPENKPKRPIYKLKCNDCLKIHTVSAYKYNRYYHYICGSCKGKLVPMPIENANKNNDIEKELQQLFEDI